MSHILENSKEPNKMKFIIFTVDYDVNSGGVIALHKLCHVLNSIGYEAYLYPLFDSELISKENFIKPAIISAFMKTKYIYESFSNRFNTNPDFNTPIFNRKKIITAEYIVIYPEIVKGNPLNANHVVRWFLHKPGFHTGKIYYEVGELYFDYNSFATGFCFPGSKVSKNRLYVTHMPIEIYNQIGSLAHEDRYGTAYCLRKSKNKIIQHDLKNSILIDNMSHHEIAKIFKRVKTFISYDPYTAYSVFAALCGADVVVVPDDDVSKEDWYPNESQRYGLAYGFSDFEMVLARETREKLLGEILKNEQEINLSVGVFVNEVETFFCAKTVC